MPRSIEVSASAERIDAVLERIERIDGVVGLARQREESLKPRGDILTIQATNEATRPIFSVLAELKLLDEGSICMSEPTSLISSGQQRQIDRESNETVWDDMAFLLRRDTNLSANYLLAMTLAGAVAAGGLWTNTLHLIIGSMIIAPAFEPLLRLPFGLVSGVRRFMFRGLVETAAGYALLALGAALSTLLLEGGHAGATTHLA